MPFQVRLLVLPNIGFYIMETSFCKNSKTAKRLFSTQNIKFGLKYEIFSNECKMPTVMGNSTRKIFDLALPPVIGLTHFTRPKFGKIQNRMFRIQNLPNNTM